MAKPRWYLDKHRVTVSMSSPNFPQLVAGAHKCVSEKYGWEYKPLEPYTFGYDNIVSSIQQALVAIHVKPNISIDELAVHVHNGWVDNYTLWRDEQPWLADPKYKAPYTVFGDERREKCAASTFQQLPHCEQEKDRCIAKYIIESVHRDSGCV